MSFDDEISLEDLLERFRDAAADEIETSGPGRVESYDAAAQTADVTPMVRRMVPRADGTRVSEPRATIRSVPVVQLRAGGFFVHLPVKPGDFVLLVIGDRDPARWRITGDVSDPIDGRAHHIAHACAIPGYYPRRRNLAAELAPTNAMVLGHESGATIRIKDDGTIDIGAAASLFVALAAYVDARISTLQVAHDTHTHPTAPTGPVSVPSVIVGPQASVAATKTRAE